MIYLPRKFNKKLAVLAVLALFWGHGFDSALAVGTCTFSNAAWSTSTPKVGDTVTLSVTGETFSCQGVTFAFEIHGGGSGGCQGLGLQDPAASINASFPASGTQPFSATVSWVVPDAKQYCFKIRLPGINNVARTTGDLALWSGALQASTAGVPGVGPGAGTTSATVEFKNPLQAQDSKELIDAILNWIFWLSIPIAVMVILYAGIKMMTAGGDAKRFQNSRKILLWAVVGLAVIFIGEGFIALIESILDLAN